MLASPQVSASASGPHSRTGKPPGAKIWPVSPSAAAPNASRSSNVVVPSALQVVPFHANMLEVEYPVAGSWPPISSTRCPSRSQTSAGSMRAGAVDVATCVHSLPSSHVANVLGPVPYEATITMTPRSGSTVIATCSLGFGDRAVVTGVQLAPSHNQVSPNSVNPAPTLSRPPNITIPLR